jgi:hypothetical protein
MRARVSRVFSEHAIAAVVSAQIGQGQKNFARVGDDTRLEPFLGRTRVCQQLWKEFVGAAEQLTGGFAGKRFSVARCGKRLNQSGALRTVFSGGAQDASVSKCRLTHPEKARVG